MPMGLMSKCFHQRVEHVRSQKRRQRGAQADVFDPQVQQCKQNAHRLLFVPGYDQGQRQVVDRHVEGFGQGRGDLDGRIGVVALAGIEQAGDAADIAEVFVEETELAACQRQHHAVLGNFFHELGVVVAARLGPVAARHQKEVPDGSGLDRCDDLVRNAQDRVPGEPDRHFTAVFIFLKTGESKARAITGLKSVGNVRDTGPADHAACKKIPLVIVLGSLDAVGRHQDGTGKVGKLPDLFLPGRAVSVHRSAYIF